MVTGQSAISLEGIEKTYHRDVPLHRWLARGLGMGGHTVRAPGEPVPRGAVAALSDISFQVGKGEAFGIIGRNGAGKSTLLQILAGTLQPTAGRWTVQGRVTALLELGSGFNPEFTGRENIYLSGSIYGIGRAEMERKFAAIADFAEIGEFIDAPVRTYSTGMLMRVAFAVAASVEPDILIIDEALSVGDILFQQKCGRRLREMIARGVTLLVVTHDTSFVLNLCQRALWLHQGRMAYLGEASSCVREYLAAMSAAAGNEVARALPVESDLPAARVPSATPLDLAASRRLGDGGLAVEKAWVLNGSDRNSTVFHLGEWCTVVLQIRAQGNVRLASGGCELRDRHGQVMFATGLRVVRRLIDQIPAGESRLIRIRFKLDLAPGQYSLDVGCGAGEHDDNTWQRVLGAAVIEISAPPEQDVVHGLVRLAYEVAAYRI